MRSYIEINQKSGSKCLTVFYNSRLDNFNEAIEKGLSDHNLKRGEATVLALPKSLAPPSE